MQFKTKYDKGDIIHYMFKNGKPIADEIVAVKVFIGEILSPEETWVANTPNIRYFTKNSGSYFVYEAQAFETEKELMNHLFPKQK